MDNKASIDLSQALACGQLFNEVKKEDFGLVFVLVWYGMVDS